MLFVMGFLTPHPPPLGEHLYDPTALHITYLDYGLLSSRQRTQFLRKMELLTSQQSSLNVKTEDNFSYFGINNEIPVRKLETSFRRPHIELNQKIKTAVKQVGGKSIERFEYSPHISHLTETLTTEITHLSVIQHDGELGNNTCNIANFALNRNSQ